MFDYTKENASLIVDKIADIEVKDFVMCGPVIFDSRGTSFLYREDLFRSCITVVLVRSHDRFLVCRAKVELGSGS